MENQIKPLPCPFCGSKEIVFTRNKTSAWMICVNCGGDGPAAGSEEKAIELWNKRVSDGS